MHTFRILLVKPRAPPSDHLRCLGSLERTVLLSLGVCVCVARACRVRGSRLPAASSWPMRCWLGRSTERRGRCLAALGSGAQTRSDSIRFERTE
jgi:hypothetical protein